MGFVLILLAANYHQAIVCDGGVRREGGGGRGSGGSVGKRGGRGVQGVRGRRGIEEGWGGGE